MQTIYRQFLLRANREDKCVLYELARRSDNAPLLAGFSFTNLDESETIAMLMDKVDSKYGDTHKRFPAIRLAPRPEPSDA